MYPEYSECPEPRLDPEPPSQPDGRSHDPLAAAVGNASLLGIGYLMLGRRKWAVGTALVTIALVIVLAVAVRSEWFELIVVTWWAVLTVHGWYLAGGRLRRPRYGGARKRRLVAFGITVPVLLVIGLLRFDASRIEQKVTQARHNGDCAQALEALDRIWIAHHLIDAPLTARTDNTREACGLLRRAAEELETAKTGDVDALRTAFHRLSKAGTLPPGHFPLAGTVLDQFLRRLPDGNDCDVVKITDWLGTQSPDGTVLDRAIEAVPRIAPAAILGCADGSVEAHAWENARLQYRKFLDQYPEHELVAKARKGLTEATQAIELAKLRDLLDPTDHYSYEQPDYCSAPAPYSGADAYDDNGTNPALVVGNDRYNDKLPDQWLAGGAAEAVLVICAGETELGAPVESCLYHSDAAPGGIQHVTFHEISIPVRVYEVRTGELVSDTTLEISGVSCPETLHYTYYGTDLGPPSEETVEPSASDIRAAFRPLIKP